MFQINKYQGTCIVIQLSDPSKETFSYTFSVSQSPFVSVANRKVRRGERGSPAIILDIHEFRPNAAFARPTATVARVGHFTLWVDNHLT